MQGDWLILEAQRRYLQRVLCMIALTLGRGEGAWVSAQGTESCQVPGFHYCPSLKHSSLQAGEMDSTPHKPTLYESGSGFLLQAFQNQNVPASQLSSCPHSRLEGR